MLPLFTSVSSESVQGGQAVFYICISIGLTLLAGLMSGLTLGLMSMDHVDLEVRSILLLLLSAASIWCRRVCRADARLGVGAHAQWHREGKETCGTHSTGVEELSISYELCGHLVPCLSVPV